MLVLLFVALWFILRGELFYVLPCVILFLCLSVLLALRLPRLRNRELILVLFVRLFDLCLFRFVGFLFLLVSEKGCGLWLWHSLDFFLLPFLRRNIHISNICTEANRTFCFLRLNLYHCPQDVKELAYKGIVCPILKYCSCVLDPQGVLLQEEIDKVQNIAGRFVTSNHCFETGNMIEILEK